MEELLFKGAAAGFLLAALLYATGPLFAKRILERLGTFALAAVVLALVSYMAVRWSAAGRPPLSNLYESLVVFAAAVPLIYLAIERPYDLKAAGFYVSFMGFLIMLAASRLDSEILPLMPALKSNWLVTHVLTSFVAYAAFAVAFVCSVLYLVQQRRAAPGFLQRMDAAAFRTIAFGFLFLTIGIISGAVWAEKAWGRYWGWDPKETWALITWLIYAFYLHTRLVKGWKGSTGAWLSALGCSAVLFTYLGVTFLLPGLHSYAS